MSDVWQGPGWWLASDGKWYPADAAPTEAAPTPVVDETTDTDGAAREGESTPAAIAVEEVAPSVENGSEAAFATPEVEPYEAAEAEGTAGAGWQEIVDEPTTPTEAPDIDVVDASSDWADPSAETVDDGWTSAFDERTSVPEMPAEGGGSDATDRGSAIPDVEPAPLAPADEVAPMVDTIDIDAPIPDTDPAVDDLADAIAEVPGEPSIHLEEPGSITDLHDIADADALPDLDDDPGDLGDRLDLGDMIAMPGAGAPEISIDAPEVDVPEVPQPAMQSMPDAPMVDSPVERNEAWRTPADTILGDRAPTDPATGPIPGAPDVVDLAIPSESPLNLDDLEESSRNTRGILAIVAVLAVIVGLAFLVN
ncbi:MAG: hypothetical protein ACR2P0_12260, partial [Acidimicrobiales bacterium]